MGCSSSSPTDDKKSSAKCDAHKDDPNYGGTVLVIGGTGKQGGSVAAALLKDPKFKVVINTRKPDGEAAAALAKEGAVVISSDLATDNADASPLLDGCKANSVDHVFIVTQFWENMDADKEAAQGKRVVDIAKELGVKHVVLSSYEVDDCPPIKAKSEIEAYLKASGLSHTCIRVPPYMENFTTMMKPKKMEDGKYRLDIAIEDKKLALLCVSDLGPCVAAIFRNPTAYNGQALSLCGSLVTIEELAQKMTAVFGGEFVPGDVTPEKLAAMDVPGAAVLGQLFSFFLKKQDWCEATTRRLHPEAKSVDAYLSENKDTLKAAFDA